MSLTLTTLSSGATMSATTLRSTIATIETYLNEGMIAADRDVTWLKPQHMYRPDFFAAPYSRTTLSSGESYFLKKSGADNARVFFSSYLNTTGWVPVPGLNTTIQIPEALNVGTYYYRVRITASFYVYEVNGDGSDVLNTSLAGNAALSYNGSVKTVTKREVYKGSYTGSARSVPYYARTQHSISTVVVGSTASTGTIPVGIVFQHETGTGTAVKHIIFQQGNLQVRYYLR